MLAWLYRRGRRTLTLLYRVSVRRKSIIRAAVLAPCERSEPKSVLTEAERPRIDACAERLLLLNSASGVASPSTLLSRSRYLLQSLALMIAASGRGDYGRAPGECKVW
eukprot:316591-Pleurochrysis_carterae.AAC.1